MYVVSGSTWRGSIFALQRVSSSWITRWLYIWSTETRRLVYGWQNARILSCCFLSLALGCSKVSHGERSLRASRAWVVTITDAAGESPTYPNFSVLISLSIRKMVARSHLWPTANIFRGTTGDNRVVRSYPDVHCAAVPSFLGKKMSPSG